MSWFILATINDGYPYNTDFPTDYNTEYTSDDTVKYPYTAWRIQQGINSDYPFTWYMFPEEGGGSSGGEVDYNISDFGDIDNRAPADIFNPMFEFSLFQHGAVAYILTGQEVADILSEVNVMYAGDPDTLQMELDFHGSNPTDYIIGLYGIPFNITGTAPFPVTLGPVTLSVSAPISSQCHKIDFGTLHIDPYFNDFRDYSPYTEIHVFIPLCGTVSLDTAMFMGHDISIDLICDLYTGACIGRVYRDNLLNTVVNGTFACQIPITAAKMGDYQNNINALQTALKQQETQLMLSGITTAASIAGGIISANPLALAGVAAGMGSIEKNINSLERLEYQSTHNAPSISSTSASDAVLAMNAAKLKALLVYKRPQATQGFIPEEYGRTMGFACNKQCKVSDISGFTVCSKINTNGISATTEEIQMIERLFTSGVYL